MGGDLRLGIFDADGQGEVVGGIVVMRYGENADKVIKAVKMKMKEVEKGLPEGVAFETSYDRSTLIEEAIESVKGTLIEEMIAVSIVVLIFLFHWRSAVTILIQLPMRKQMKEEHAVRQVADQEIYTCPMHPEIIRDKAGRCPICGMYLVKKETTANKVEDVKLESLLKPTNSFVVSSIPVTTIQAKAEKISIAALGNIAYDTRQAGTISARIAGRIEKLYVRYRFQKIRKGGAHYGYLQSGNAYRAA